jgi:hypothetical protein
MEEGGTRAPRIRMPRISLPTRSRGATGAKPSSSEAATKEKPTAKQVAEPSEAKPAKPATDGKDKAPEPNLQERIEGLQGWMAELERKQARLTYFGITLLVMALLAAGTAIYIGLAAKSDSATKSDVDALTKKVDALEAAATKNSKDTQNALNASAASLQASIAALQKQQSQQSASISSLQSQAQAGAFSKGAATLTPGATTTTTPKKP